MKLLWLTSALVLIGATVVLGASVQPAAGKSAAKEPVKGQPKPPKRDDKKPDAAKQTSPPKKEDVAAKPSTNTRPPKPPKRPIKPKPEKGTNATTRFAQGSCEAAHLCCAGRIDTCFGANSLFGCYCDEYCMENGDCCEDYVPYCQGKFRCWEVDPVNGNPCNKIDAGGLCTDSPTDSTAMTCTCSDGFVFTSQWNSCAKDVCSGNPCAAMGDTNAHCQILEDLMSFQCVCSEGYEGSDCTPIPTDACLNVVCGANAFCDSGYCVCQDGYYFNMYLECVSDPCGIDVNDNNPCNDGGDSLALCFTADASYSCLCSIGYEFNGESCVATVVDLCLGVTCGDNQICIGGACVCLTGFFLNQDGMCKEDACVAADSNDNNPCNNGVDGSATCVSDLLTSTYSCICSAGFSWNGGSCEVIDPCMSITCDYGWTCEAGSCVCAPGFFPSGSGGCFQDPCVSADLYDSNPCNNNGDSGASCLPDYFSSTYTCSCSEGWILNADVANVCTDPCAGVDCGVGGYCSVGFCICYEKYFLFGGKCYLDPCNAADPLDGNPCNNNGNKESVCNADYSENTYSCSCSSGWTPSGGTCVDQCSLSDGYDANPCNDLGDSNAVCFVGKDGNYGCSCSAGWIFTGKSCAGACASADSSDGNPCNNDGDSCGACEISGDGYECSCSPGFASVNGICIDINECDQPYVCNDCGACRNTPGGYFCVCGEGYRVTDDGKNCESLLTTWLNVLGIHK